MNFALISRLLGAGCDATFIHVFVIGPFSSPEIRGKKVINARVRQVYVYLCIYVCVGEDERFADWAQLWNDFGIVVVFFGGYSIEIEIIYEKRTRAIDFSDNNVVIYRP